MAIFMQAQLLFCDQRAVTQFGIRHQTAQSPGTSGRGDKLGVYPEPAQSGKITQVLVRPARDERYGVEIVCGRGQFCLVAAVFKIMPKVCAGVVDEPVGGFIGKSPIPAGRLSFMIFITKLI